MGWRVREWVSCHSRPFHPFVGPAATTWHFVSPPLFCVSLRHTVRTTTLTGLRKRLDYTNFTTKHKINNENRYPLFLPKTSKRLYESRLLTSEKKKREIASFKSLNWQELRLAHSCQSKSLWNGKHAHSHTIRPGGHTRMCNTGRLLLLTKCRRLIFRHCSPCTRETSSLS